VSELELLLGELERFREAEEKREGACAFLSDMVVLETDQVKELAWKPKT
jgi:hypothetical protein